MNGSRPRNETSQPLTTPDKAADHKSDQQRQPDRDAAEQSRRQSTAASPSAEPTLISMPPVRTMINSAITTTPMMDIWSSRFVMLVPVRKAGLASERDDQQHDTG